MGKAKLLKLTCEGCGGKEFIEDKKNHVLKCVFCDTPYYLDKPVGKKKTKIINNFYNVYGALDQNDNEEIDRLVKSANYYMVKLKNYDKAREIYQKITDEAPNDYRGWWGLIRADNYNLNSKRAFENGLNPHEYEEETEHFNSIRHSAPKSTAQKLRESWNEYLERNDRYAAQNMLVNLQSELKAVDRQIAESRDKIKKSTYDYSVVCVKAVSFVGAVIAVIMILSYNGSVWNLLLVALFCVFLDFVFYSNMFDVVELFCSDLHEALEKERATIVRLNKKRSMLIESIKELSKLTSK